MNEYKVTTVGSDGEKRVYMLNADNFEYMSALSKYYVNFYEVKVNKFLWFKFREYELVHRTVSSVPIVVSKVSKVFAM